jgi:hypothetical protein
MRSSCISKIRHEKFLDLKNVLWEVPASQKYVTKSFCISRILCKKFLHLKGNWWTILTVEHTGTSSEHLVIYTYTSYTITGLLLLLIGHTSTCMDSHAKIGQVY